MTVDLPDGKQVVVSSDRGAIRLQLWANRGSLGLELDRKAAIKIRTALLAAILAAETQQSGE